MGIHLGSPLEKDECPENNKILVSFIFTLWASLFTNDACGRSEQ